MSVSLNINYEYVGCEQTDFICLFSMPKSNIHILTTLMRIKMAASFVDSTVH
jgi:hypothetical protein